MLSHLQSFHKNTLQKIAGMTPYSDGIEIHQDSTKAQRQVFQGFDSWFMMNLLSNINI